ncbi:MAG: hypothetical protein WC759_02810 [Candidatus Micrarchaeia archaeon]|jgi:hypothetical protein
MASKQLFALAFLLLFAGIAAAQPGPGPAEQEVTESWLQDNWIGACLVVVFITIFFLAICYMIAEGTNSRELKAWTITELFQAGMSLVILILLVILFAFLSTLSSSMADTLTANTPATSGFHCTTAECHIDLANKYLVTVREEVALPYARHELKSAVKAIGDSTFKVSLVAVDLIPFFFSGFSIRPYAGKSILADRHMLLFDYASRLSGALTAQEKFLTILQTGLVPLLLIGGVLLRSIFFTRRVGGLMIAIAIGLFTVFPLVYLLAWYTQPIDISVLRNDVAGATPDEDLDNGELLLTYPARTTVQCVQRCDASLNSDCKSACTTSCTNAAGTLDPICYGRCAVSRTDPSFLCDSTPACQSFCTSPSQPDDFSTCAQKKMADDYPTAGTCNYLIIALNDPYATECGICPSKSSPSGDNADCRRVFRHADDDLTDGVQNGLLYTFNEMKPFLSTCLATPEITTACESCYNAFPTHESLTISADPDTVSKFMPVQGSADQVGSPIYSGLTDFGGVRGGGDVQGMGLLIMVGAILPMFDFILTITFVKGLSPLFGGDIDIEGLMRLI